VLALLGDSRDDAPRVSALASPRPWKSTPVVAIAALVTLVVAGLLFQKSRASRDTTAPAVVVLPFTNIGADTARQYLSDGITEELIAGLARVNGLRVVARSVAFRYRGAEGDPRRVARELNASNVLSGSVRVSGRGLHVVAELTRADGSAAWSKTFDTDSTGVTGIEAQVIEATTQHMRVDLGEPARSALARRAQQNPEAHDLYLRGRFFWTQRSEEGLRRAIDLYRESIDREPGNTYALSGLADAYAVSAWYSYLSPDDGYGRAKQIAAQALAIDSTLAEPNASLGYVALYYDWDWKNAQRLFQRSIALDSTYATAHQWYGNYHIARGELPEAVAEFRAAEQLDPANRISTAAVCWGLLFSHRAREALAQCQRGLDLDSTLAVAHLWRGQSLELLADTAAAITELETAVRFGHRSAVTVAGLAHAQARFGHAPAARTLLSELESATGRYRPSYEIATVYAALGERDQAIRFLERAIAERAHSLVLMAVDPALDPMRDDPRLTAIIRRVGLTPIATPR
jgi:TolB-like protein